MCLCVRMLTPGCQRQLIGEPVTNHAYSTPPINVGARVGTVVGFSQLCHVILMFGFILVSRDTYFEGFYL